MMNIIDPDEKIFKCSSVFVLGSAIYFCVCQLLFIRPIDYYIIKTFGFDSIFIILFKFFWIFGFFSIFINKSKLFHLVSISILSRTFFNIAILIVIGVDCGWCCCSSSRLFFYLLDIHSDNERYNFVFATKKSGLIIMVLPLAKFL